MRDFTAEEKELIASTPITVECFGMENVWLEQLMGIDSEVPAFNSIWRQIIQWCEFMRGKYEDTKDERYFTELVRLLPASYKVVKL